MIHFSLLMGSTAYLWYNLFEVMIWIWICIKLLLSAQSVDEWPLSLRQMVPPYGVLGTGIIPVPFAGKLHGSLMNQAGTGKPGSRWTLKVWRAYLILLLLQKPMFFMEYIGITTRHNNKDRCQTWRYLTWSLHHYSYQR